MAFVIAVFTATMQQSHSIHQLFVFGDSLSDIGTVFKATGGHYPPNPPYYRGRYSNGPVWVEHLASKLALSNSQIINAACGGATTGSGSINGIPGMLAQVGTYTKSASQTKPKALYVLWAGANDYLNGANSAIPVENISKAIASLVNAGAKTLLIANLPDLGNLPATRNSPYAAALSAATASHNLALAKALDRLRQQFGSEVRLIEFDAHTLYQDAIAHPAKFGFTNVTGSCISQSSACNDSDRFLFWDGIHPTVATHRILADRAFDAITQVRPVADPKVLK